MVDNFAIWKPQGICQLISQTNLKFQFYLCMGNALVILQSTLVPSNNYIINTLFLLPKLLNKYICDITQVYIHIIKERVKVISNRTYCMWNYDKMHSKTDTAYWAYVVHKLCVCYLMCMIFTTHKNYHNYTTDKIEVWRRWLTYANLINRFKPSFSYPQSSVLSTMTLWHIKQLRENLKTSGWLVWDLQ